MGEDILARRLRSLREERGYLQKFVADKLGIKSNTLSGYENGTRSPDPSMLSNLADLYNVSIDYLLGRTNIRNQGELAAHRSDDFLEDLPEEAVKELETFKEFIRSKYGNKE
ncbi:helix-turn-helix transcriptional regulator [Lysinibacillus sp. FSL K6-0075]|uniref:helix-turn-helix domain-containing protein n=1 Tax=Lysinibacillus sp. FSL K6-0075 TaxID=2921415 RepID=UPI003157F744